MRFRKKPVVIEAVQYTSAYFNTIFGTAYQSKDMELFPTHALIHTLEGTMRADLGDWIITGVNNEKYPCKPNIFEKTYERVDE